MKDATLLELADKWARDAVPPEVMDGSPAAIGANALAKGIRISLEKCASDLRLLVDLLGETK